MGRWGDHGNPQTDEFLSFLVIFLARKNLHLPLPPSPHHLSFLVRMKPPYYLGLAGVGLGFGCATFGLGDAAFGFDSAV
jgi:hypothetical protein